MRFHDRAWEIQNPDGSWNMGKWIIGFIVFDFKSDHYFGGSHIALPVTFSFAA